jgi:hypothetical protein
MEGRGYWGSDPGRKGSWRGGATGAQILEGRDPGGEGLLGLRSWRGGPTSAQILELVEGREGRGYWGSDPRRRGGPTGA